MFVYGIIESEMRKGSHHTSETKIILRTVRMSQEPPMLGKHHTQETKDKCREAAKQQFLDPKHKKTGWPKGQKRTSEQRLKDSEGFKFHTHECCGCVACQSMRGLVEGNHNGMFGKQHSDESKKLMSESLMGHIPWNKGLTKNTDIRLARCSDIKIQQWKDPEFSKMMLHRRTPSGPEKSFIDSFKEFKYVGNGDLNIDGKNPDFVCITDDHKLVEIWGEYYKKGRNPQDLIDFYKVRGYGCLVIWASELRYLDKVMLRISKFVGSKIGD